MMAYPSYVGQIPYLPGENIVTALIGLVAAENETSGAFIHVLGNNRFGFIGNREADAVLPLLRVPRLPSYIVHYIHVPEIVIENVNKVHAGQIICEHKYTPYYTQIVLTYPCIPNALDLLYRYEGIPFLGSRYLGRYEWVHLILHISVLDGVIDEDFQ